MVMYDIYPEAVRCEYSNVRTSICVIDSGNVSTHFCLRCSRGFFILLPAVGCPVAGGLDLTL
jgi:hypothetical protein